MNRLFGTILNSLTIVIIIMMLTMIVRLFWSPSILLVFQYWQRRAPLGITQVTLLLLLLGSGPLLNHHNLRGYLLQDCSLVSASNATAKADINFRQTLEFAHNTFNSNLWGVTIYLSFLVIWILRYIFLQNRVLQIIDVLFVVGILMMKHWRCS